MTTWDPLAAQNAAGDVDAEFAANALGELLSFFHDDAKSSPIENPATATAPTAAPAGAEVTGASGDTVSPVPTGTGVSQGFMVPNEREEGHPGLDLSVPLDTQLLAAASGKITSAGQAGNYGNMVEITTNEGFKLRYGHLHGMNVKVGDTVRAGQVIGSSGGEAGGPTSGNSTGAHLHFEFQDASGKQMDPTPFLAGGYQILGGQGAGATTSTADPNAIAAVQLQNVINVLGGKPMIDEPTSTTSTQAGAVDTGEAGTDPDQWIRKAMAATGVDESWFAPLKARMMQESGGRNIPQGIVDINTQQGTPAFGPMQVIEPTFRSHMMKGHEDWHNPVDNTIAAINYIKSRYGHPSKLPKGGY